MVCEGMAQVWLSWPGCQSPVTGRRQIALIARLVGAVPGMVVISEPHESATVVFSTGRHNAKFLMKVRVTERRRALNSRTFNSEFVCQLM